MPKFMVYYTFHARASKTIEAETLEAAQLAMDAEVNTDNFYIDADEIDDVDFTVREMHPVTRNGKEIWTTYTLPTDKRGHASALKTSPLFAQAS